MLPNFFTCVFLNTIISDLISLSSQASHNNSIAYLPYTIHNSPNVKMLQFHKIFSNKPAATKHHKILSQEKITICLKKTN